MSRLEYVISRWPLAIVAALAILTSSGCIGLAAQVLNVMGAGKVPAECTGLEKKRVAVVCLTGSSSYGNGLEGKALARMVSAILKREIKDIEIVSHMEIEKWIDTNNWDETDYRVIGRGVQADMLVAIDLSSLDYYDGPTLYKGRASYRVNVYDMQKGTGEVAFSKDVPNYQYPIQGGWPVTEMVETEFQKKFLASLAQEIGMSFYAYDPQVRVARDTPD